MLGGLTAAGVSASCPAAAARRHTALLTCSPSAGLVANFGGCTSLLLGSLDGGRLAKRLRVDVLYPVSGYTRCLNSENRFEFLFPASWLADQRLLYRAAERVQQRNPLDMPPPQR